MRAGVVTVVLAGGEGRRMGGTKALRPFRGATLLGHAVGLARRWSDDVAVAVREPAQAQGATDAPLLLDADVPGPLAGLAAALAYARERRAEQLLTLPCDMPDLPADLGERLAAALTSGHGVALAVAAGELQPVCGLWRPAMLERLDAYLAAGRSSLRGFAADCGCALAEWPPEQAAAFANANSLDELARLSRT